MTVPAGRIVKFVSYASVQVYGSLDVQGTDAAPMVLTSFADDSAGGDWGSDGSTTKPNDVRWNGVAVFDGGSLIANKLDVRYLQNGYSGLSGHQASVFRVTNSVVESGIYVARGAEYDDRLQEITLTRNTVKNGQVRVQSENSSDGVVTTVKNNTVTGHATEAPAFRILDLAFRGQDMSGNTATGGKQNVFEVSGVAVANWTVPAGINYVVGNDYYSYWNGNYGLGVAADVTVTVPAGRILKFRDEVGLKVAGILNVQGTAAEPVIFTSMADDSAGGDWNGDGSGTIPHRGIWAGISIETDATMSASHLEVRYVASFTNAGSLTLVDSTMLSSNGILQRSGATVVDVDFVKSSQALTVNEGSAQLRGSFTSSNGATSGPVLSSCNWSEGCFVDAVGFNWGTADGPGSGSAAMACGAARVSPWAGGSAPGQRFYWSLPNCDGSTTISSSAVSDASASANAQVSSWRSLCTQEEGSRACQVVDSYFQCLNAAIQLGRDNLTFAGISPPTDMAEFSASTVSDFLNSSSNVLVSTITQVTSFAFQVLGALRAITSVRDAYSQCAPGFAS